MNSRLFLIGALVSVGISIGFYKIQQPPVEILILLLLQWILTFCLELRYAKLVSDNVLGDFAMRLRADPSLLVEVRDLVNQILIARSLKSVVIDRHLDRVLEHARNNIAELANGTLRVDLGPGGRYIPDLVDLCKHKYQGVSLVKLEEYWHGPAGKESLRRCRKAIEAGKTVERIFIEHLSNLPSLASFVREHEAAGVRCFIVIFEQVDTALRKDFAIIDDDEAAVCLTIDTDRSWIAANYCVNKGGSAGCSQLKELVQTWSKLVDNSTPADEFFRSFPLLPAADASKAQAASPLTPAPRVSSTP